MNTGTEIDYDKTTLSVPIGLFIFVSMEAFVAPWKSLWRPMTFECIYSQGNPSCGKGLPQQFNIPEMTLCSLILFTGLFLISYLVFQKRFLLLSSVLSQLTLGLLFCFFMLYEFFFTPWGVFS